MDDEAFNIEDFKLKPEQLKDLRPTEPGAKKPKPKRRVKF
jgi:hypothetical protein